MRRAAFQLLLALALFAGGTLDAHAGKRVALVIGNSAYEHTRKLPNPKNDATAIAASLKRIGFDQVTLKLDQDYGALRRTLRDFGVEAGRADVAVVYYAGHGLELGGQNYLVPTDAKLLSDRDLEFEAVKLATVLGQVKNARTLRMVILDACRNNPLGSSIKLSAGVSRSVSRGFGRIEPEGDVLVAYAAKHGTVASDGDGTHSPYTAALLRHLQTPGLDVGFLFRRVRSDVLTATARQQEPFTYGSLGHENIYLVPPAGSDTPATAPVSSAAQTWAATKDTTSLAVLEAFIKQFPDSVFATLAKARLGELKKAIEQKVAVGVFPKKPKPSVSQDFKPGKEFQDCPDCPKMVVMPAGSFMMGSPSNEKESAKDEGPQREVTIAKPFAVGKFEITLDEFKTFVDETGHKTGNKCLTYEKNDWKERSGRSYKNPGFTQNGAQPVVCVTWADAKAYVTWLSRKTGKTYRLLSEAEWEYAARAGTTTPFSTGRTITTAQANFDGNYTYNGSRKGQFRKKTVKVGSFSSNGFGLHDMHGNVFEWVEDCWTDTYRGAPLDGRSRTGGNCSLRVLRGGSWISYPWNLRSAYRGRNTTDYRNYNFGFRVARTLTP